MTANRAASIRARLKQHTDTSKQDFNLTLTQYGLERLLCRLSISEHAPNFLLKGALLFQLWYGQPHRPTRDADLLGFGPDDVPTLVGVFRSICSIAADGGIVFDPALAAGAPIRKDAGYGGVRISVCAPPSTARALPCRSTSASATRSRPLRSRSRTEPCCPMVPRRCCVPTPRPRSSPRSFTPSPCWA
jgi:Nucleotidyl transferase AbiEii toxin, Type IV TA system